MIDWFYRIAALLFVGMFAFLLFGLAYMVITGTYMDYPGKPRIFRR